MIRQRIIQLSRKGTPRTDTKTPRVQTNTGLLAAVRPQTLAKEPETTTLPQCVHHTYVLRSAEHVRMIFSITLESRIRGHLKYIHYPVPTTLRLHTAVHVYARVHIY